jgi:cystathionine beta-lyase/cystathionine gamma-synthase
LPPNGDFDEVLYGYARDLNPNARWLEERLLALEGGEDCVVTASGVSAINGTFLALLSAGDHLICSDISVYFGAYHVAGTLPESLWHPNHLARHL